MIVAVTGATGVVGRFVCERFAQLDHEVRAMRRPDSLSGGFTRPPHWVLGDMLDQQALRQLIDGADTVVHCAFSHLPGRYRGGEGDDPESFWRINMEGTLRLLEAARRCQVDRVVLLSSRAVFARRRATEDASIPIDDEHPLWPDSHYGALKAAQEALASAATDLTVCALRPTGVYGVGYPVEHSKWHGLINDVLRGVPVTTERTATEVHGYDVADAILTLAQAPADQVRGRGFNCSDLSLTTRDLVARIARIAGCDANLPNASHVQRNQMQCDALQALGWSPGGYALLETTLSTLIRIIRDSTQQMQ